MKTNLLTLILLLLFGFAQIHAQQVAFEKRLDNYLAKNLLRFNNGNYLIVGQDSLQQSMKLTSLNNGQIGHTLTITDTTQYSGSINHWIEDILITRRNTFVVDFNYTNFNMGTITCYHQLTEADSVGNVIWSTKIPDLFNLTDYYEQPDGNYIYFGSLDDINNHGEPIYGIIDTTGTLVKMSVLHSTPQIIGFLNVLPTLDGFIGLGVRNSKYEVLKFDSSMNVRTVNEFDIPAPLFSIGHYPATSMPDSGICYHVSMAYDTSYVVFVNNSTATVTLLRLDAQLYNAIPRVTDSLIYICYTTTNYLTGVLVLDRNYNTIKNVSIGDSSSHSFFIDATVNDSEFVGLLSNSANTWCIRTDTGFSSGCNIYPYVIDFAVLTQPITADTCILSPFGASGASVVDFVYGNPAIQWDDSCIILNNDIGDILSSTTPEIYPNPAREYIYFNENNYGIESIRIYNINGSFSGFFKNIENKIDISQLKPGMYIIEATTKECIQRGRFIKIE